MIERKDVEHVAALARLKLSEEEKTAFTGQLGSIIEYVEQLEKAPTENVEPTCFVSPDHDPLREDKEKESLPREKALENGPKVKKGHFAIPKVINS